MDASNNLLDELDLRTTENLIELICSGNPITNLSLTSNPDLISFDCLGVKLIKADSTPPFASSSVTSTPARTTTSPISSTCSISTTETVFVNNPQTIIGLTTSLGASLLGWIGLGTFFCYKRWKRPNAIPTPGSR